MMNPTTGPTLTSSGSFPTPQHSPCQREARFGGQNDTWDQPLADRAGLLRRYCPLPTFWAFLIVCWYRAIRRRIRSMC
jgi:hypothetical protein